MGPWCKIKYLMNKHYLRHLTAGLLCGLYLIIIIKIQVYTSRPMQLNVSLVIKFSSNIIYYPIRVSIAN